MKIESCVPGTGPAEGISAAGSRWGTEVCHDEPCSGDPSTPLSSKHKRLTQSGNKSRLKFSSDGEKINQQSAGCDDKTGLHSGRNGDKIYLNSGCNDDKIGPHSGRNDDKISLQSGCSDETGLQTLACGDKTGLQSESCRDMTTLRREKRDLTLHLTAAEEKLRKLKMVKMYRSKVRHFTHIYTPYQMLVTGGVLNNIVALSHTFCFTHICFNFITETLI